jgi:hypothetical protein
MNVADVTLGLRVRRHGGSSSLVPDRRGDPALKGRRTGVVTTLPVRLGKTSTYTVNVRWEGTDIIETIHVHRLEPVPSVPLG